MNIQYTTDGMEFHFVTLTSTRKKINKIFVGNSKKEVKGKLIEWLQTNMPDVPLWKINFKETVHQVGWNN